MENLYELSLNELLTADFGCDCGKKHSVNAEAFYGGFDAFESALKKSNAKGKILFICSRDTCSKYGEFIDNAIKNADCIPETVIINRKFDDSLENISCLFAMADDVCLIAVLDCYLLGVANYFASVKNIPLIAMPLSADADDVLSTTASVVFKGKHEKISSAGYRYIIINENFLKNSSKESCAVAFASLASAIVSLIDYRIRGTMVGERLCKNCYDLVRSCISGAINIFKNQPEDIPVKLLENKIKISVADIYTDGEILSGSGESCVAKLLEPSGKKHFSFSERKLYAAYKLIDLYNIFFKYPHSNLLTLPDLAERAENYACLTGAKEYETLKNIKKRAFKAKEVDKKLNFVNQKFYEETKKLAAMKDKLFSAYVKLGGDKDLLENYSPDEIHKAVYYAPDTENSFSVLNLMRDTGVLELLKN